MLLGFVGVPATGKSTIATKIYTSLKETGSKTELIVEQARQYIAKLRLNNNLSKDDPVILTDQDQISIASEQHKIERAMKYSCGIDTIIVSDSSAINSMLYMSNYNEQTEKFILNLAKTHYDLIFFCHTIENLNLIDDPNRIHNKDQIKEIGDRALKVLKLLKENVNNNKVHELMGAMSLEHRTKEAISYAMNMQVNLLLTS